jgi:PAS domain S-box-containing protein
MSDVFRADDHRGEPRGADRLGNPFEFAFRTTRMAMVMTDPCQADNPILLVNDAFTRLTGYHLNEVVGRNCRFLQGPETSRATADQLRASLAAGEGAEVEILNYRKDGTPFWNALVISPVRDSSGRIVLFFASQSDISEKKRIEFELVRAKESLEEQVSQRTRDFQVALDQKTALLHEVDHRVKNSLQVISSLVLLNARRMQDQAAQRVLYNLAERVSALSTAHRLLYSVGDVSRFDLGEFMSDLVDELMPLVPKGRVNVTLAVEPVAVAAAKAAPLALLANELIGNALKHAYPGPGQGTLSVRVTQPGTELRIVVEDDGVGFGGGALPDHGFGKTLIDMLVRQLKARLEWQDARPGTRAVLVMPLDTEEAQF